MAKAECASLCMRPSPPACKLTCCGLIACSHAVPAVPAAQMMGGMGGMPAFAFNPTLAIALCTSNHDCSLPSP